MKPPVPTDQSTSLRGLPDTAKSVKELSRLMNRGDIPNIQYSLRQLMDAGPVENQGSVRSGVTCSGTQERPRVTVDYDTLRRVLLTSEIRSSRDLR